MKNKIANLTRRFSILFIAFFSISILIGLTLVMPLSRGEGISANPGAAQANQPEPVWTARWENLGGASLSSPAVASWSIGRIDVFWRGTDNRLKYKWKSANGWSREMDLGGSLSGDPAAVSWAANRIDVFWRGDDGSLRHIWYSNGNWSAEQNLGIQLRLSPLSPNSGPAVASWESGRLDLFWRGTDNRLRRIWYSLKDGWSSEQNLGNILASNPAAVSPDVNRINVFWKDANNHLKQISYSPNGWSGEQYLADSLDSAPAAASEDAGHLDVFWKTRDNKLAHKWVGPDGNWMPTGTAFENLGGNITSSPAAASGGPGQIEVIGRGPDSRAVLHKAKQFTPWFNELPPGAVTLIGDTLHKTGDNLWEFSSIGSPAGSLGCSAERFFLSGGNYETPLFLRYEGGSTNSISGTLPTSGAGFTAAKVEADNVMARLPNGTLLLVRLVRIDLPFGPVYEHGAAMIWASTDCGTSWQIRSVIDSADTARFAPPDWDHIDSGYAEPQVLCDQNNQCWTTYGRWDRPEIYADPWNGNVYITMAGRGGIAANLAAKYEDTLLFRSTDAGVSWEMTPVIDKFYTPLMITSVGGLGYPSTLFLFHTFHDFGYPYVYWSLDGGATLSPHFRVSTYINGFVPWHPNFNIAQGCQSLTRIGRYQSLLGNIYDTVRVVWSSVDETTHNQVVRVASVTVKSYQTGGIPVFYDYLPKSKYLKTISVPDGDVIQSSVIQPDPSLVGLESGENTAFIFWLERKSPSFFIQDRVQGMFVRDEEGWSPPTYLSLPWIKTRKTGDYIKGAFSFNNSSDRPLRYLVPWIETSLSEPYELRTVLLGMSQ